jgi:hypothetical protein
MLPPTERDGEPAHDRIGDHSGARLRSMICCVRSILSDELDRPSEARIAFPSELARTHSYSAF